MQVLIVHFSPLIEWRRRDEAICSWHQGGSAQATVAKVECRDRRERVWRRSSRCLRNQTWAGRQGRWRSGVAAPMRACDVYGGHVLWQDFVAQGHVIYAPSIRKGWRQVGGQARVQLERWRTWSLVRGIDMLACCDGGQPSLERADTVCQISVFSITDQLCQRERFEQCVSLPLHTCNCVLAVVLVWHIALRTGHTWHKADSHHIEFSAFDIGRKQ